MHNPHALKESRPLDRRAFLLATAAAAVARSASAAATPADAKAAALYGQLLEGYLAASPEAATTAGLDTGPHADLKRRLDDRSYAHRFDFYDGLANALPQLSAIDEAALSGRGPAYLGTLRWTSERAREFRRFAYGGVGGYAYPVPYNVSQVSGAYQAVPDFLDTQHVIASPADAEAYLDRLAAFAPVLDQETARIGHDAGLGVAPPGVILDRTLKQLAGLLAQHGEASGLAASLARRTAAKGIAGDWGTRAAALVDGPVAGALDRQIAALTALRPQARTGAGVESLPDGGAYYAMCLRFHTSTNLTPDAAHALGLEQVKLVTAEARAVLAQQGVTQGTVGDAIKALSVDPAQLFPDTDAGRAALLDYARGLVKDMYGRLPGAFTALPKTPMEVRRVPPEIELGSPGAYSQSGSLDGTRPGAIYFNLHDTANWPKWQIPTTVYHESVPGHHLQGSIANEAREIPTLVKLLGANAYAEGWALYAEQLADEIGAYDDFPLGRLGRLQASLFRACRIVVDTGLHAKGWSREQAIAYLIANAGSTPDDARREIERYMSWPGQACGYKIGHLEFERLRDLAKAKMGPRFSLKSFHDTVLLAGSMPLEVMAREVARWAAG
ncbi:MAG: hypothetical protein JWQ29_2413 [Phenylobacterium sp.]|nr:hypothetical protein [Phenylobacterium sp.]